MEIDFKYALSDDEARARLELLGKYLVNRHGIQVTWVDDATAKFSGKYLVVRIDGELTMRNGRAQFKGEDPGFLWRGRAKDYIEGKLAKYLDPKANPAELPTGA
ncbi:MAG TPA: polyhydroxyalkanoic acid system family protein [Kofleriaceae bacterium]|nr:polyhydroxyalkanoic acid system family protein [Kofleriaceae bacterium]